MRVYAFLDLAHPAVAWAVMRGILVSADSVPGIAQQCPSFMLAGMIKWENAPRLFNEGIIEQVRAAHFPNRVSRLRGMYFFRPRDEAEARIGDRLWPSNFVPENLIEFELEPNGSPTVVDANWITFAPIDQQHRLDLSQLGWIASYWKGETFPGKKPVWEMIANGIAVVLNRDVRRKCYEGVLRAFPESWPFIEMARIGGEVGSHGGLVMPFFQFADGKIIKLCYLMRDAEFKELDVKEHPDSGSLGKLMHDNPTWRIPDLTPLFHTFQVTPVPQASP